MNRTRQHRPALALLLPAVVAAVALTACGREEDDRTAGQRLDDGIAKVEQKTDEARAETREAMDKAGDKMAEARVEGRQAMDNMGNKMERATERAGAAIDDAQITTAIKASLAGDPKLSALDVKVETEKGHVTLDGTAPDLAARDRAGSMALAAKGVQSVNNRIKVNG